jgi:rod shape-determining protein MreC
MAYSVYYRTRPTVAEDILGFIVTPIQSAINGVTDWIGSKVSFYSDMHKANDENIKLKEELLNLKIENERLSRIEREYVKIEELLDMHEKYPDYHMTGVSVIAADPGVWYDNILIDKGRKDSVFSNMAVIGVGGLVGRVTEAGYNYSRVRTLIEDTFSVSAKSARTDDTGIVKGDMKLKETGLCKMERININADILAGDEIVTSNLGNIYPPGITIGIVKEISVSADALTKTAIIEPLVDFNHLDGLLVVTEVFERKLLDGDGWENNE